MVAHESMLPAPVELIEDWLARVSVKTARRKDSAHGDELALSVYTNHLRAYPADVVRHVLANYRGTWFPTWGELADQLDELTEVRAMIRDRLLDIIEGRSAKQIEANPLSKRLDDLREELAALNRIELRFPEIADESSTARRLSLIAEIEAAREGAH